VKTFTSVVARRKTMDPEKELETTRKEWEKKWRQEKADRTATIHNALVDTIATNKAHVDELIIALEILLHETLELKMAQIRTQSQIAVETLPKEIK